MNTQAQSIAALVVVGLVVLWFVVRFVRARRKGGTACGCGSCPAGKKRK